MKIRIVSSDFHGKSFCGNHAEILDHAGPLPRPDLER